MTESLDQLAMSRPGGLLLAGFAVHHLYGRFTHEIKVPASASGPGRLILLHGDNGCGKTTLLRLLWHALSPAENRNHRSELAQIPFETLTIDIPGNVRIIIRKVDGLLGSFDYIVERANTRSLSCRFQTDERGRIPRLSPWANERRLAQIRGSVVDRPKRPSDEQKRVEVHSFLRELHAEPLFLADDRRLYTDDPELDRLRELYAQRESADQGGRPNDVVGHELRIALRRVNDWLRTLTVRGQNVGSAGANSIYREVLKQLATTGQGPAEAESESGTTATIASLLADLRVRSPRFERYDLVPHFDAHEFEGLLRQVSPDRIQLTHDILIPYLNTLSARCDALEDAEELLTTLLSATNDFLVGKRLVFSARSREGLRIVTDEDEPLDPLQLSSGERQLTMLVCTTLLAGRDSKLFLIDEPELSLGVPWQRRIIESLLSLTARSSLQFIVATHSIEVISSQLDSLVALSI